MGQALVAAGFTLPPMCVFDYQLVMAICLGGMLATLWPQQASGQVQQVSSEKFRLSAGPCAAKGYPMTIQFGAFVRPDGKTLPVPAHHTLEGKWGLSSIGQVVGDEFQPVPVSLEVLYFSYLEDTFYEGAFPLPQ